MAMGRPKAELVVSDEEQAQLQSIARSRSLPAALVRRANMVLACAAGATNSAVARRFGTTNATVGKWRQRFVARRIEGLHDELRPGKPRSIDDPEDQETNKFAVFKKAEGLTGIANDQLKAGDKPGGARPRDEPSRSWACPKERATTRTWRPRPSGHWRRPAW